MSKKEWDEIMKINSERAKEEIAEAMRDEKTRSNNVKNSIEGGNVKCKRMSKEEAAYIRAHAKKY